MIPSSRDEENPIWQGQQGLYSGLQVPQKKKEESWLGLYISLLLALSPLLVHQEQNCHMWLLASYTFLKDKSKVVFLMPEIV